jgi:hypothetical protein
MHNALPFLEFAFSSVEGTVRSLNGPSQTNSSRYHSSQRRLRGDMARAYPCRGSHATTARRGWNNRTMASKYGPWFSNTSLGRRTVRVNAAIVIGVLLLMAWATLFQ